MRRGSAGSRIRSHERDAARGGELPQFVPNLASTNLYDLAKGRELVVSPDAGLHRAIHQAVAVETSRSWHIAEEKQAQKIDVVVALTQAVLRGGQGRARGAGRPVRAVYRRRYEEHRAAGAVR